MLLILLIQVAAATFFHLFQWYGSKTCGQAAPDSVYVYGVSHKNKWKKAANETWPPLMKLWAPFYPFSSCGNLKVTMDGSCCTSIDRPAEVYNITSATTADFFYLPANQTLFPSSMNGNSFCVLSNYMNYTELYVGTGGYCIEKYLKCNAKGTLDVYPEKGCTGSWNSYSLTAVASNQTDATIGDFTAEFRAIGSNVGTATIGWTEFLTTTSHSVIDFFPLEILETFCYLIILLLEAGLISYFSYRYYKSRTNAVLLHVVCHIFWLVYVCLTIQYTYARDSLLDSSSSAARSDLLTARSFFIGLSSLMTAMTTTIFIVVFWRLRRNWTIVLTTSVLIIHFGLIGGRYLYAGLPRDPTNGIAYDENYYNTVTFWTNKISFIWFIFLFVYDLLPIMYLIAHSITSMANVGTKWQRLVAYLKIDKVVSVLFCSQPLLVIGYFVNEHIRAYTSYLGNDRNHQATASFSIWFIAIHSAFNTIVTYRIARNIKEGTYFTTSVSGNGKQSALPESEVERKVASSEIRE